MDSIKRFFQSEPDLESNSGNNGSTENTSFLSGLPSITSITNPFADTDDNEFNFGKYFELSYKQRLYGFIVCFCTGMLCSLIGTICIFFLNFVAFGVMYSIGNVCTIMSTMFVVGPLRQFKNMFDSKRLIATIVFIVTIALTLCAALWWKSAILCIVFLVVQMCAFIWYALSYIPYGRDMLCGCFKSLT